MIEIIYEKLSQIVDFFLGKWAKVTEGKRGADDVSGFLWILGVLLLILDMCLKKKIPVLVVGIVLIAYGLLRCFSNAEFHDVENTAFLKVILAIKNLFSKFTGAVGVKYNELKATDRKQIVDQLKEKVDKEERKQMIEQRVEERAEAKAQKAMEKAKAKVQKAAMKDSTVASDSSQTSVAQTVSGTVNTPVTTASSTVSASVTTASVDRTIKSTGHEAVGGVNSSSTRGVAPQETKSATPNPYVNPTPPKPATDKDGKNTHYIFECPGCKRKVRIPNRGKKGRVAIVCPACNTRFVKMRW